MNQLLTQLVQGQSLTKTQTIEAFEQMMGGTAEPIQIAAMLAMIQQRGPSIAEITGAASVMRLKATHVHVPSGLTAIDTCGTGGDHVGTFNISTAAAIVAAGAGRPHNLVVAKHGNRSVTSKSGSSQVLEKLGVQLQVSPDTLTRCLEEAGLCFCFAPAHHPAMKHVMPVRLALGIPTLFNLLGPLTNPASAKRQLMGVFKPELTEPLAQVLANLGAQRAMVVHGQGLDELITWGTTRISELQEDGQVRTWELDPATLGLPAANVAALKVADSDASAKVITSILQGKASAARDIVCLNAAGALVVGDLADDFQTGLKMAQDAIDSGAAATVLKRLVQITHADAT